LERSLRIPSIFMRVMAVVAAVEGVVAEGEVVALGVEGVAVALAVEGVVRDGLVHSYLPPGAEVEAEDRVAMAKADLGVAEIILVKMVIGVMRVKRVEMVLLGQVVVEAVHEDRMQSLVALVARAVRGDQVGLVARVAPGRMAVAP